MTDELKYRLALHFLPGIGPVTARALLAYCGSIENIFKLKKSQLEKIPGIGKGRAAIIQKKEIFERVEREMVFMDKSGVRALFYLDDEFPYRLKNCDDAPLMLFYKGTSGLNRERMVAIVGTRFMTTYGKENTEKLVHELSVYNVTVVSGLAYGIDAQAHKSALTHRVPTVGVVAHGLDRIYPAENMIMANKMIESGGLVSEYPSRTKPDRNNFPARNRIVAGLCDAVIIIESAEKGGALITADLANDYNRDVFALPGRVTDHFSRGCHRLIRENKAFLFESAYQVAELMGWENNHKNQRAEKQLQLFKTLNEEEQKLVQLMKKGITGIDELSLQSKLKVNQLSSILLNLEFAGVVRTLPGRFYELIQ